MAQHGWCHGFIIYGSNENTHMMDAATRDWKGYGNDPRTQRNGFVFDVPALQMFSVNYSVGKWLEDNSTNPDDTVSGFFNQTYIQEEHPILGNWTPGVTAYNVEGNITTNNNPTNAIVICGQRYDAWWGQCPGDSGAGAGMVLAVAKYMKDNNITPKYNITFLETTGEEYGFRGAWHYNHSHPVDDFNIIRWIGFDQLGFKQDTGTFKLIARCNDNETDGHILKAIANDIDLGIAFDTKEAEPGGGVSEDVAWLTRPNCKTICFAKSGPWSGHHETGQDFTEGDSMKYMNRSELNATLDLAWLVMKYYTVNPDCWFDNIQYETFDSTGGTKKDSLRATFKVKSTLPSDLVMVNATFIPVGVIPPTLDTIFLNFTANRTGAQHEVNFTLPQNVQKGPYDIVFKLYNSTGKINESLGFEGTNYNQTITSPTFYLHRWDSFGDERVGTSYENIDDKISGSVFTKEGRGVAKNITAYVLGGQSGNRPTYKCLLYRDDNSQLIGVTEEKQPAIGNSWITFSFPNPKPVLYNNVDYNIVAWGNNTTRLWYYHLNDLRCGRTANLVYGSNPADAVFSWNANHYSLFCSYTPDSYPPQIINVSCHPDTVGFGYNVTINANVTDNISGVNLVKVQVSAPIGLSPSTNYTMTHVAENTYQYVFTNTWFVGQYNYTIWAVDNATNINSSSGHHFHVSAQATISVCTMKDTYGDNETINLTDPPQDDGGGDDDGNDTQEEPYQYWSPPGNSFGISPMNMVNWSYFWGFFKNHSSWQMEGWNPVTQQWQNSYQGHILNEYLHIIRVRSTDNSSEKITLNFTSPFTTKYRFTFGIDLHVKDYVNRTGHYEYTLTYPISETENYTVFFNWSDIVPLVQQGKITLSHGIKNMSGLNVFWFMITGNGNLPAGHSFEIDPTFGSEDWGFGEYAPQFDPCIGGYYQMGGVDGTADSITTYVSFYSESTEPILLKAALYDSSGYMIADGETEEVNVGTYYYDFYEDYVPFPFADPKPVLQAGEWYYLVFGYENLEDLTDVYYVCIPDYGGGTGGVYSDSLAPPPMPDPFAAWYASSGGLAIYCSYTPFSPIQSEENPGNGSTDIGTVPWLHVTCSDPNDDTMSATWWSNSSGSWAQFASNSSIANNTVIRQTNGDFNNYSRLYYWRVHLTDGSRWDNETYHFTTGAIETSVDTIAPYTVTSSPRMINATGSSDLHNVTLYYGYSSSNTNDWWGTGWSCRKKITINSSQVAGNFSNFPILVNITDGGLASHAQEDGDDIVFVSYGDNTTRVNHEIETFNGTTGKLCAWVNIPCLRSTGNTMLWMYYGNPSCGSQQNVTGVWDSVFKAVWHLSESPTGTVHDSTGNNNDMTSAGSMTSSDLVNGRVGKAIDFDGSNDYLSASDSASLKPTSVSLLAWYYPRANSTGMWDIGKMCMDKWGNYDGCSYGLEYGRFIPLNYTGRFETSDNTQTNPAKGSYTLNNWHFLATTHDGASSAKVYVDGVVGNPPTVGVQALRYNGAMNFYIAASHSGVGSGINRWTSCIVDEVWVINGVLNESYIATLYNNQYSPSTFMSCGSEENSSITWMAWNNAGNPDTSYPWSWSFDFPNSTGYYKFYSIGEKSGSVDELTPDTPDAQCHYMIQSKIVNTGSTDIRGYLLIQVQYLPACEQCDWVVDHDTVNETTPRTINAGQQLALDTIFNGLVNTDDLVHGAGPYRVYVAFRDPEGNILKTNTGSELKAWWLFNKT